MRHLFLLSIAMIAMPLAAQAQRSSPFNPPTATDSIFITDSGSGLDTGCTYRGGGPLVIKVEIDRYVGEVDSDGHLKNAGKLIANNVISPKASLRLPVYDIDINGGGGSYQPEHDRIFFNGEDLGRLTGDNNIWKLNEFQVDISKLKFPSRGSNGAKPSPAINEIRINIDESNTSQVWCMAVDWTEINFKAMAPILLIHGTNAQSDSWEPNFTNALTGRSIPFSHDINLVPNGSIDGNARLLKGRVNDLAKSFGAQKVHLIAHSKGGLDARRFLSAHYTPNQTNGEAEVLSLTTITTPHHGTILSDLSVANRSFNDAHSNDSDVEKYLYGDTLFGGSAPQDPALSDQTTANMAAFNTTNTFPGGIGFYSISADADTNNDGAISDAEADPLITTLGGEVGSLMYRVLGNVASITVTRRTNFFGFNEWHEVIPTSTTTFRENDLVVTVQSARHPAAVDLLQGDDNHSSIKSNATSQIILDRINADHPVQ
jgi:pimeloyl-ACP methyl ester carboxylesterase